MFTGVFGALIEIFEIRTILRLRANLRTHFHELASAARAALAFGLLLRKFLPARFPAARIPGALADVFGEFGRGVGHGWSSCPQATQPESFDITVFMPVAPRPCHSARR